MNRNASRVDSVILTGPRQWALDHIEVLKSHRSTWMQYSASVSPQTSEVLEYLNSTSAIDIYLYVPSSYTGGGKCAAVQGSGKIEFRGAADDCHCRRDGTRLPYLPEHRPTTRWPQPYDCYQDKHAYEYWFKVVKLAPLDPPLVADDFVVYRKQSGTFVKCSASDFAPHRKLQVVLARRVR